MHTIAMAAGPFAKQATILAIAGLVQEGHGLGIGSKTGYIAHTDAAADQLKHDRHRQ